MRVRVVGINRYTDRHGRPRLYWRRRGVKSVALDPALTGAELAAEVSRLEQLYLKPALKAKAGTLRGLVQHYKANSNHWKGLRPRTRLDYERVYTWLGDGLDYAASDVTSPDVAGIRDRAATEHEPKFANLVVTVLKMAFRHGREYGLCADNPALGLSKAVGGRTRENRPYAPADALTALHEAPAALRPAVAVALYCGIRGGDVIALPHNCRKGDWITFEQSKTRSRHEAFVCEDLARILDAMPLPAAGAPLPTTLLVSSAGRPWTMEGLKSSWALHRDRMVKAGKLPAGATFHGLRHTGATILEEAGYEEGQTRHFLGHGPKTVSGHYARSAKRRELVKEMAETIQRVLRESASNVVQFRNGSS